MDDIKRPTFPKWSPEEQEIWIDQFSEFCGLLMGHRLDHDNGDTARLKDSITRSAELADHAMQEIGYRFWIQESDVNAERERLKAAKEALLEERKERTRNARRTKARHR